MSIFYIIYFYIFSHAMEIERGQKNTKRRIFSLDELLYTVEVLLQLVEVLLQLLEFLQHVVVDGGVAEDTDTRCQFLHQLVHRFALLATRRSTRNAQTSQDRGVDAVAVALDDLHAQCFTRVHNVSTLIHRTASRILLDVKVNNGKSYFNKKFYRKEIRKNQRTRRTKNTKK